MEALTFITAVHLAMIPVTVGVVGAIKSIKWFNTSYSPLAALVVGIGLAALLGGPIQVIVIAGLVIGLSACGLYSGVSSIKNA